MLLGKDLQPQVSVPEIQSNSLDQIFLYQLVPKYLVKIVANWKEERPIFRPNFQERNTGVEQRPVVSGAGSVQLPVA
jgi:hypothetical protein